MSNELIHEVEESIKQEELNKMFKEYGPYIIGGVVLAILLTGMISAYKSWEVKVNNENTARLVMALRSDNIPAALGNANKDLRGGQKAVSYLSEASLLLNNEKYVEALAVFEKAVNDADLPADYRDLARVQASRLAWDHSEKTPEAHLAALQPVLANAGSPWHWHARMQAALILGTASNKKDVARAHLSAIKNAQSAPVSLRQRAEALEILFSEKNNVPDAAANEAEGQG